MNPCGGVTLEFGYMRASFAFLMLSVGALSACNEGRESPLQRNSAAPVSLELAWELAGSDLAIGDNPIARESASGALLVGDARIGSIVSVDSTGLIGDAVVTPGSGPLQATPPISLWVDGDTAFVIPGAFGTAAILAIDLQDRSSRTLSVRARGEGDALTAVACAIGGCLIQRGRRWSIGSPLQRPGQSVVDSAEFGWLPMRAENSAAVEWVFVARARRVVSFEWPDGPIPFAAGGHEFDMGTLFTLSGETVWWLESATATLHRWRSADSTEAISVSLPRGPTARAEEIEDTTRSRVREARTDLDRNRLRATRNLEHLPSGRTPEAAALIPASAGGVGVELFADGTPLWRHYLLASNDGVVSETFRVPGDVKLLYIGASRAYGYSTASDHVIAFRLPESLRR